MTNPDQPDPMPFVSVICPVYNAASFLPYLIKNLQKQTYPAGQFEVIFVDNGSSDNSAALIAETSFSLHERTDVASSYAARNKGIDVSKGEILAFIDSDCRPDPDWLKNGVRELIKTDAPDMAAGKVSFTFTSEGDPWEVYDALFNINMENAVLKGHAATANLFVRREVFEKEGRFSESFTSGEDFMWTHRAVKNGAKLIYVPAASVEHPTRRRAELLKKSLRVGGSLLNTHAIYSRKIPPYVLYMMFILKNLLPPSPFLIRRRLRNLNRPGSPFWQLYAVAYTVKVFRVRGLIKALKGQKVR